MKANSGCWSKPRRYGIAGIVPALLLGACSLYPDRPAQPVLHDFGPAPAMAAAGAGVTVDAPAWLGDDRLRYRMLDADPTVVRFYTLHAWLAPPPALLEQYLRASVAGSAYRLRLSLTGFEQVFDHSASAHIQFGFRADALARDGKIAAERLFQYTFPCPTPDANGAVSAYAAAVSAAANEVRNWLAGLP